MTRPMRIEWEASSDVGRVRQLNEDSFVALPERGLWIVADGMGGHEGGDWASALVTASLASGPRADDFDGCVAGTADAIHAANAAIWGEAQRRGVQMGTTVVALAMLGRRFAVLWAGDSRAYLLRDGALVRLTRDHSQVQALVDRGLLSPEDALGHPMAHVLARAVGVEPVLSLDAVADAVAADDLFLLTSDGVHGVLDDAELARLAHATDLARLPDALIGAALERGSTDNCTALAVAISEATMLVLGGAAEEAA